MKYKTLKLLLPICVLPVISLAQDKNTTAKQLISNVQKKLENIKLIEAEFIQTFYWSLAEEKEENLGKIYIGKNDEFRIETPHQLVVSDGKSVWTVSLVEKQVIIDFLDPTESNYLPQHLFANYHKDFDIELAGMENVDQWQCYHIVMKSRTPDIFIQKIDIWIDKIEWLTRKLSYFDANENTTSYIIKKIRLLDTSNNTLFRYMPGDSSEVIDLR